MQLWRPEALENRPLNGHYSSSNITLTFTCVGACNYGMLLVN